MARENFNKPIIAMLALRVDNTCSNPECRVITQAPSRKTQGTTKVGEAAHICAASPGGARYSVDMTSAERVAYDNGIWLCSICATLIDREPEQYSVEVLKQWKSEAEASARSLLGRRRVSEGDVSNQVKSILLGVPVSKSISTITNAHAAVALSLEALDPRFNVLTSRGEKDLLVELRPRERVPLKIVIDTAENSNWKSNLQTFIEHGKGFKTPARHIRIEGSSLLEHIRMDSAFFNGDMIFEPVGEAIRLQWTLLNPRTKAQIALPDLTGTVVVGAKSGVMSFKGYDGLLNVAIKTVLEAGVLTPTFSITLDTQSWMDCDLKALPHLQSLSQIFSNLRRGWLIEISIARGNEHFGIGMLELTDQNQDVLEMAHFLEYTAGARRLARRLNISIKFPRGGVITGEDVSALASALEWLDGADGPKKKKMDQGNINLTITVGDPHAVTSSINNPMPQEIFFRGTLPPLTVFGQEVEMPMVECVVRHVVSRTSLGIDAIASGEKINMTYDLTKRSTISIRMLP